MKVQGVNSDGELLRSVYVEHEPVAVPAMDDGVTRQEFRDECDINVLLARYEKTGVLNHFSSRVPQYLDVSEVPDLATSLEYMEQARAAFMTLPAVVRREFDNDPVRFVDFAADAANLSQMRQWGLAAPEKPAHAPEPLEGATPKAASDSSPSSSS